MEKLESYVATSALHDTSTRQGDETTECHANTRKMLLGQLSRAAENAQGDIQWLYGPAGAGKTSIMRSLASILEKQNRSFVTFFFWNSDDTRNTLRRFVATVAYQLAQNDPSLAPSIGQAMSTDALLLSKSSKTQLEKLIIEPLRSGDSPRPWSVLIDGLDECDAEGQTAILEVLLPTLLSCLSSLPITIFIASRQEPHIENMFSYPSLASHTTRIFLEPSPEDVQVFLDEEFEKLDICYKLKGHRGGRWPKTEDRNIIATTSSGYFIFAKTAIRHINPHNLLGHTLEERLRDILDAAASDPFKPLDALYLRILQQNAPQDSEMRENWRLWVGLCCMDMDYSNWGIIGGVDDVVFHLFGKQRPELSELFSGLQPLIYFDDKGWPRIHHKSFPDFIFNRMRSGQFHMAYSSLCSIIASGIIRTFNVSTISRFFAPDRCASSHRTSPFLVSQFLYSNLYKLLLQSTLASELSKVRKQYPTG